MKRLVLAAVATATAIALVPAGAAMAQPGSGGLSPARAPATPQRTSLTAVHLVTGVVRDQSGRPVSDACVLAASATGQVKIARTGSAGQYQLALPRTGAYTLSYRTCAAGHAATGPVLSRHIVVGASAITSLPAMTVDQHATTSRPSALAAAGVVVPAHQRIIRLQPGQMFAGGRAQPAVAGDSSAAVVTGKVTNPAGHALSGTCAWIVGSTFAVGVSTDKDGVYRFDISGGGVPNGRYPVQFDSSCLSSDPFGPIAPGRWAPQWYQAKFAAAGANKVLVKAGKTTRGINAMMRPGGEVSGTVAGSDHRRLKNACAVLTDSAGQEFGQAFTNAKGQYTITGLDPGNYRLLAVPACRGGTSDYGQTWYQRAATVRQARVIKVRLGHRTGGINVVLPKLGTITGFVRLGGKTGKPLAGMCVNVFSPSNFEAGGFATSQRTGKYVVQGLPAGRYQVEANVGGCGNNGNYAQANYQGTVRVAAARTTSGINLYMQPGGTLTGKVTNLATGQPVAGICVGDGEGDGAVTANDGTYAIKQLPAERTAVGFSGGCGNAGSYAPQYYDNQAVQEAASTVTITAGHTTGAIDAALLPGATISGTLQNAAGRAARGICVFLTPGAPGAGSLPFFGSAITGTGGSYTEANLAPGSYAVAFFAGCEGPSNAAALQWFKGQPDSRTAGLVATAAGQTVTGVDARLGRGGGISGTVTAAGQPVDFDCVYAVNQATGAEAGFEANSGAGQFTLSALPAGRYWVTGYDCLEGSNLAPATAPQLVTVRAGYTTGKVRIDLARGGTIEGRVTTAASGSPVRNGCVTAGPVGAAAVHGLFGGFAQTSRTGSYKITGVAAGQYRIFIYPDCAGTQPNLVPLTLTHLVRVRTGKVTAGVNASLRRGAQIVGFVTGPAAQAEPGVCVEVFRLPGGLVETEATDAHGKYTASGLAPGSYKLELNNGCSDGGTGLGIRWVQGLTVQTGVVAVNVNVSLPADGTISGSVTGTGPAPLTGVCVSAVPVAAGQSTVYAVSGAGSYTLAFLTPGKYRVEFQAGCGKSGVKTQWWDAAASSATAKVITVAAGATVSGIDAALTGS
jgi:hypothetical protein